MDYLERNHRATLEFMMACRERFDNYSLPIKPTYLFDVIAMKGPCIFSIRIVCTESKQKNGLFVANLLRSGGYERRKEQKIMFDPKNCDYVFVWTPENKYLIPSKEITQKKALTLSKFQEFKIIPS